MNPVKDRWIRWATTGCVALLALIAGTVLLFPAAGKGPGCGESGDQFPDPGGELPIWLDSPSIWSSRMRASSA
jgi:hypothetical protein